MANRIVTATVTGESIKLSEKSAGAAGSFNAVSLAFTFDGAWDGTTKKIYFFDAYGANAVYALLTLDLLVDGKYIVPIPAEPLVYAGEMTITVRGIDFATDGTTAERIIMSASTTMKVLNAITPASDVAPVEPTPTQSEQLQAEIDALIVDIGGATESASAAAASALAAQVAETAAELAITKNPYIDETTNNWFIWNAPTSVYVNSGITAVGAVYQAIEPSNVVLWVDSDDDAISSVTKSDIGLENIDNTSDANKPVSSATQTALNLKISTSAIVNNDTTGGTAVPASAEIVKTHGAEIDAHTTSISELKAGTGLNDGSITPAKTSFFSVGKNLYDLSKRTDAAGITSAGAISTSATYATYSISALIPVIAGKTLYFSVNTSVWSARRLVSYDATGAIIEIVENGTTYVVPSNATKIMFSGTTANMSGMGQVEYDAISAYESYRIAESTAFLRSSSIELVTPKIIPAVIGHEVNLYYNNCVLNGTASKMHDVVFKNITGGVRYPDRWQFTPLTTGTVISNLYAYPLNKQECVGSRNVSVVRLAANVGSGLTKKVLLIGDSLIANGNSYVANTLNALFAADPMQITLLGSKGNGADKHEGISGWDSNSFANLASQGGVTNPFYNPSTLAFDFSYYMAQNGYASVDYVCIHLGTNDKLVGVLTDAQIIANYNAMIASIHAHNSAIQIFIGLTENVCQLSWASTSTVGQDKELMLGFVKLLKSTYDGRESEKIYTVPCYINIDLINDFATTSTAISARNTGVTEPRVSDRIHPALCGYQKRADMLYNYFKYVASIS